MRLLHTFLLVWVATMTISGTSVLTANAAGSLRDDYSLMLQLYMIFYSYSLSLAFGLLTGVGLYFCFDDDVVTVDEDSEPFEIV